jgi:hypothetical protein
MFPDDIGLGWKTRYIPIVERLITHYPDITISSVTRRYGMLQILADHTLDDIDRFIVDSVLYKIERSSARVCELCGEPGRRRTTNTILPEILCLCWECEAIESSKIAEVLHKQQSVTE